MESEIGLQDDSCLYLTKLCNCKEFASYCDIYSNEHSKLCDNRNGCHQIICHAVTDM